MEPVDIDVKMEDEVNKVTSSLAGSVQSSLAGSEVSSDIDADDVGDIDNDTDDDNQPETSRLENGDDDDEREDGEDEEEEQFEAEKIIAFRLTRRGVEYFVKWKGYPDDDNTW